MSTYLDRSRALRDDPSIHYNCAQAVFLPFAEAKGMTTQQAFAISANFGAGMRMGSVCGAITGALMALGLYGMDDAPTIARFYKTLKERHGGHLDCKDLLAEYARNGGKAKKPHCDGMVYECVELAEEMLKERGLL